MKKIFKLFIVLGIVILLSGCGTKKFTEYYNNMEVSKDNINGYSLNLRIYSSKKANIINRAIKVDNYMNKSYKISEINMNKDIFNIIKNKTKENIFNVEEEIKYLINGKLYEKDKDDKYVISSNENTKYTNPNAYLEGLMHIKKVISKKNIKIGDNKYKLYKVTIKKEALDKIIDDTGLKTIEKKDLKADIYIDSNEYLYKIIYKLDKINIEATYSNINKARDITLPN